MIRMIAAIDEKQGMANEAGIPWRLPADQAYFREHTIHNRVLMGYRTYIEFSKPLSDRENLVFSHDDAPLRPGFIPITQLEPLLQDGSSDLWIIGGAALFAETLQYADELYITEIQGDFHCTKFFPPFKDTFELVSRSPEQTDNGISFTYCIYRRIAHLQ